MSLNAAGVNVSKNRTRINCFVATAYFEEYQRISDPEKKKELLEKADYHLDKSIQIHPIYKNSLLMKAGVLAEQYKMDNDLDKLLDGFLQVRKIRPIDYVDTYLDYLQGRADRNKLLDFYHRLSVSELAQNKKDYKSAIKYLNDGLKLDPGSSLMLKDLCIVYGFAGNTQRSVEYGERALAITPQDGELLYHLGVSYDHLGDKPRSEDYLTRARALGIQNQ
jgi:tetratricopeptide (TPR) repeat protein